MQNYKEEQKHTGIDRFRLWLRLLLVLTICPNGHLFPIDRIVHDVNLGHFAEWMTDDQFQVIQIDGL